MRQTIVRKKGLELDRAGFIINNHLFPPESFATGYVGSQTPARLALDLESIAKKAKAGIIDIEKTPLLKSILFGDKAKANPEYALAQMADWVDKKNGKKTFVTEPAAMEVNKKGDLATRSTAENISMKIRSRTEPKSYTISLYNAAGKSLDDLSNFNVDGGARNTQVSHARGTHWRNTYRDELYLDSLTPEQRAQYTKPISLIDYTRAAALITLNDLANYSTLQIGGGARGDRIKVTLLPWQFGRAPEFANEVVARQHAPPQALETAGLSPERPTDAQSDMYLIANADAGFVSEQALMMLKLGIAIRGATVSRRHFPNESWAMIQALEKHMLRKGRKFDGYSIEFRGTRYETIGIRFEFPQSADAKARRKSAIILYDDNFELPFIMYKTRGLKVFEDGMRLGTANPAGFVNISSDIRRINQKPFQEWDWTTSSRANETIFEPSQDIRTAASTIALNATQSAYLPQDWRDEYITLSRQRRFKVDNRS